MPDSEVWNLCEEYFEWRVEEFPEFSTFCGQHDHDDRLNEYSSEAFARRLVSVFSLAFALWCFDASGVYRRTTLSQCNAVAVLMSSHLTLRMKLMCLFLVSYMTDICIDI